MIPIHQDRFDSLHFIQENSQVHVNNAFMNDYHSIQNPFLKSLRKHLESLSKSQATSFPKLFLVNILFFKKNNFFLFSKYMKNKIRKIKTFNNITLN